MHLNWIKITERAAEGIKIINKLDDNVFTIVINYVHKNMSPDEHDEENQGLEELEKLVKITRPDFLLLIKTLSYILKRVSTFIMKPTKLHQQLKEKLQLQDNKIDVIMQLWLKNIKPIYDKLDASQDGSGVATELESINWKIKAQISAEAQQKDRTPIGHLQLCTNTGDITNLEMNHTELYSLYNKLEIIQNELDLLKMK